MYLVYYFFDTLCCCYGGFTYFCICSVKRKGCISNVSEVAMLTSAPQGHQRVELPKLLANETFQEESGGYETMSEEDNVDALKDNLCVEYKSSKNVVSKKRKAKLGDSRFVFLYLLIVVDVGLLFYKVFCTAKRVYFSW